ncbi:hypothetical protein U1Q18_051829, partial [Sarracenia purpurea var. burkii]
MNMAQGVNVNHDIACRVLEESHTNMTKQVGVYEKQDVYRVLDGCSHPKISFPNAVADQFVVKLGNALNQDCLEGEKEKQVGETKYANAHGRHPLDDRPLRSWANI